QGGQGRRGGGGVAPGAPAPPTGATSADLFSGDVKISADKPSNALVVMASGSDYATVQRLVDKLDRPRRQVFVEAVIMEVNLKNDNKFGVSMHAGLPVQTGLPVGAGGNGTGFIPLASETGRVNTFDLLGFLKLGGFLTGLVGPVSQELKDLGLPFSSFS